MAGIKAVGDFQLITAEIITSSGVTLNIKSNVIGLNFYEDCQRNTISGDLMLQDSAGYVTEAPIIGQEYLKLKIQTPSFKKEEDIINFTQNVFIINGVQSREKVGNKISAYLLSFTSSEIVKNQRIRVNGSVTGTYSDIVMNMLTGQVDCQKKLFIEPTRGVKRMVVPNLSPFGVIDQALANATSTMSENFSPSYLFYETFKGYHFRSLASLYAQPIIQTYTSYVPGSQVLKGGIVDIEKELGNILGYEIVDNSNSLYNFTTGVLGSKLIVHNIYSKSFKEYKYNYFDRFDNEKHITSYHGKKQYPIFSDVSIEKGGARSSDFPARTYLNSISEGETDTNNTTLDGTEPFSAPDPQNSLQERASTMNQLNKGLLINILTHGNTSINAGDIVKIDVPNIVVYKTDKKRKNDRFYQGVFMIKRIKHEFNFMDKKHKSYISLVKDSLEEKLDGPQDIYEPKPEEIADVITEKEFFYPQL